MKKSNLVALFAFLAGVAAVVAGVVYYLRKKEAELAEAEEMLYSEDYLADYLPKEDDCCECCCEEAEEAVEDCCECCCEEAEEVCTEE